MLNKIKNFMNNKHVVHIPRRLRDLFTIKRVIMILVLFSISGSAYYYMSYKARCKSYQDLVDDLWIQSNMFSGDVGIFIKDLWTGKSIRINSDKLFPSASLVKVPIMAAVFQARKEGRIRLSQEITLRRNHKVKAKNGLYRKRVGTKYKVSDLIEKMIVTSDNTATNMLVEELGYGYLNQKFVEFGLKQTDMRRGIMELKWRNRGIENYTTPDDMAFLLEKIYRKKLVSKKASIEMIEILKNQRVNDRIPYFLPRHIDVAHKTGSLRNTISDVGIVFTPKGDFIICVLTLNSTNLLNAKKFIRRIADYTYKACYAKS